jgi:hypothetical protein
MSLRISVAVVAALVVAPAAHAGPILDRAAAPLYTNSL